MACVLTVALVEASAITIGHVGDTRLYKIREDRIEKVTRDHSPVGEREDSNELSEEQAMRHPRRHEVYRDVGSEKHDPSDTDFVDIEEIPFEPDSALLLCSDGLSDLIDSATIARTVREYAGDPESVVRALIDSANSAGGRDNVTVVYVEGEQFAARQTRAREGDTTPGTAAAVPALRNTSGRPERRKSKGLVYVALAVLALSVIALAFWPLGSGPLARRGVLSDSGVLVVRNSESIAEAIEGAQPGTRIIVEPGEYRERVVFREGIRIISRVSRGAIIRLPSTVSDADAGPAVVAVGVSEAELSGFRIVGDAATPLGIGIDAGRSGLTVIDVEISGAMKAGIDFGEHSSATLLASEIHDNPGPAVIVRSQAMPRIAHTTFRRNGLSEHVPGGLVIDEGSAPVFERNVFIGMSPDAFFGMDEAARAALKNVNWFLPVGENAARTGAAVRRGQVAP
jgi:hypothetical protein